MKKISNIVIILGCLSSIVGILPFFIPRMLPTDKSIGIIGGAESEISEQITQQAIRQLRYNLWCSSYYPILLIIGVVIVVLGVVLLIVKNKK